MPAVVSQYSARRMMKAPKLAMSAATNAAAELSEYMLTHAFQEQELGLLAKCGVPPSAILKPKERLDVQADTVPIVAKLEGINLRRIAPKTQLTEFLSLLKNPLKKNEIFVVSSFPSDRKSLAVGVSLMAVAIKTYMRARTEGRISSKEFPLWHRVLGGYSEPGVPRDKKPCFLIASNVIDGSTQSKWEKLRDLLVMHDDIPRVVVTAGLDPLTFCCEKLRFSPGGVLYLGPSDRTQYL